MPVPATHAHLLPWIVVLLAVIAVTLVLMLVVQTLRGPIASGLIHLRFSRESLTFYWAKILGAATLITTGFVDLSSYGVTPHGQKIIMTIAGLIGVIGGLFGRSPLPSKAALAPPPPPNPPAPPSVMSQP